MNESTISMKALLQRVRDGEENFAPANETLEALEDFQFVVKALNTACSERLIESVLVEPHSKDRGTYGMAKAVVVSGGLTTKGVEYLSAEQPSRVRSWLTTQIVLAIAGLILSVIIVGLLGT
jgi:hypothetical protein